MKKDLKNTIHRRKINNNWERKQFKEVIRCASRLVTSGSYYYYNGGENERAIAVVSLINHTIHGVIIHSLVWLANIE